MATYTVTAEVPAKKSGTCSKCIHEDPRIVAGDDYVAAVDGTDAGWLHPDCARHYARHREAYDQLNRELDEHGAVRAGEET